MSVTVPHHHRNVIFAVSARRPDTAPLAGRPWQLTLPLERLQQEGFIRFHDAVFTRITKPGNGLKKAMTPQKSGVLADAAAGCLPVCLTYKLSINASAYANQHSALSNANAPAVWRSMHRRFDGTLGNGNGATHGSILMQPTTLPLRSNGGPPKIRQRLIKHASRRRFIEVLAG